MRLKRAFVINLEKSISQTDKRAGKHVMLPGDDEYDSMIDRSLGGNSLLCSINMSKSIHLKHVDVALIGDHRHECVFNSRYRQ